MDENLEKNKSRSTTVLVVVMLLLIALMVLVSEDMSAFKTLIKQSGFLGILLSIGIYGVMGASIIPSEPFTVFISALFGPLLATIIAGVGNTLAAVIEYYIGAKISDATSFAKRKEKLPLGLGKLPVNSPLFLLGGRMVPGYGPKMVSVLGGVYRVPLLTYIWTAMIPTFVGAAIFAYGGFGAIKLLFH